LTTIIRKYGKFDRLPSLAAILKREGWSTAYYYAGDAHFANTRSYLEAMGFDEVLDEDSHPYRRRTDWGAYDEELFALHLQRNKERAAPFFHLIMTSTSHEPFDVPVDEGFTSGREPDRYRNAVHYTDHALGDYLEQARKMPWYDSTLIVIVPDHGHFLPLYRQSYQRERHHIPLLLTGGALSDTLRGHVDHHIGSHVDLAATLLAELGIPHADFPWSKDLRTLGEGNAFWTFEEGFGMMDERGFVVHDLRSDRRVQMSDTTAHMEALDNTGKALLQVLMDQYVGL
jgi:phosphoglycerol transferase MdoB-like AlkP superfamily enzyme